MKTCVCICAEAPSAVAPQITKSVTCPDELGALASQVTGDYSQLAVQGRLAAHTAEPEEVRTSTKICNDVIVCYSSLSAAVAGTVFRFIPSVLM